MATLKNMLIIGTSNKMRFNTLKSIVSKLYPQLNIVQQVMEVDETGSTPEENVRIKLQSYYAKFAENTLCVDDALELDDPDYSPGTKIRRNELGHNLTVTEVIQKWQKILRKGDLNGKLIKSIGLITKEGEIFTQTLIKKIKLVQNMKINTDVSPLNNFIFPSGYHKPLSQFTSDELNEFRQDQTLTVSQLLTKITK